MEFAETIEAARKIVNLLRRPIGFVPTMGFLHKGHASLIEAARKECESVVLSIFVNPLQFGPTEDYDKYPRDFEADSSLATKLGVDLLFAPGIDEMYPRELNVYVGVGELANRLCGRFRPSHFEGVVTIVSKLFNIIQPDIAYFGQKDYQQFLLIKKLIEDLNFGVEPKMLPIVREEDGVAASSRNKYLGTEERDAAALLYKALISVKDSVQNGEANISRAISKARKMLDSNKLIRVEYFEAVDPLTLESLSNMQDKFLIAIAAYVGTTRLIDNIMVG